MKPIPLTPATSGFAAKAGLIAVAGALVVGGGAFYGGMQYQKSRMPQGGPSRLSGSQLQQLQNARSPQERQQLLQQFGAGGGRMGRGFGGGVTGQIISADATSLTVKLADGSTRLVYFTNSTTVAAQTTASTSDLVTGKTVMANGTPNSDNSVSATRITIQP